MGLTASGMRVTGALQLETGNVPSTAEVTDFVALAGEFVLL